MAGFDGVESFLGGGDGCDELDGGVGWGGVFGVDEDEFNG